MIDNGIGGTGVALAAHYREMLKSEALEILTPEDFASERDASITRQQTMEASDTEPFEDLLARQV